MQYPELQKNSSISDLEFESDPNGEEACKFNETILTMMIDSTKPETEFSAEFKRKNVTQLENLEKIYN